METHRRCQDCFKAGHGRYIELALGDHHDVIPDRENTHIERIEWALPGNVGFYQFSLPDVRDPGFGALLDDSLKCHLQRQRPRFPEELEGWF